MPCFSRFISTQMRSQIIVVNAIKALGGSILVQSETRIEAKIGEETVMLTRSNHHESYGYSDESQIKTMRVLQREYNGQKVIHWASQKKYMVKEKREEIKI